MWKAAFLKGGGLGLYGDYLFAEYSRHGRTFLAEAGGPMMGVASDVRGLYTDAKNGN